MRVCLNMIVKNESAIIARAIDSAIDLIDSWCIVDTGSNDDTIEIIKQKLSHLPGEVISRPWVNFGHNRSEAYAEARKWGDWILLMDADMLLVSEGFNSAQLDPNVSGYQILQKNSSLSYYNTRLLNSQFDWECVGVTHEYYSVRNAETVTKKLDSIWINDIGDGGSKSDKFERDIALLLKGLEDEPNNERYQFYLAQSYKDIGRFDEAIKWYEMRIASGGWREEVWYSHYMIAVCHINLGMIDDAESWVRKGYDYYPNRSEAIYEMCRTYRVMGNHKKAYEFYLLGKDIPYPKEDLLFISHDVYHHLFDYELTILHYYLFPNDRLGGLRHSFNYLAKRFDQNVYSNSKFYLTRLSSLSINSEHINVPVEEGFTNTSPCYLKMSDGTEIINVRQVNYKIDRLTGAYRYIADDRDMSYENTIKDPIITKNHLLGKGEVTERYEIPVYLPSTIVGLEDIRLFESDGTVRFLATTRHLDENHRNRIATGKYDHTSSEITVETVFDSPFNSDCEKNWIALNKESLIYSWHPLLVLSYPGLNVKAAFQSPSIFSQFRGSTGPVKYKGLNWLVVHSVIYESPRTYLHYLVALDDLGNPILYTLPFSFEGEKIEYCLGLNIENDIASFYYSTWDSSSKKMTVSLSVLKDSVILA